jgi:hypothetical protein
MLDVLLCLDRVADIILFKCCEESSGLVPVVTCLLLLKEERSQETIVFITYDTGASGIEHLCFRNNSCQLYAFNDKNGRQFNVSEQSITDGIWQMETADSGSITLSGIGSFTPCNASPCPDIISEKCGKFTINPFIDQSIRSEFENKTPRRWYIQPQKGRVLLDNGFKASVNTSEMDHEDTRQSCDSFPVVANLVPHVYDDDSDLLFLFQSDNGKK